MENGRREETTEKQTQQNFWQEFNTCGKGEIENEPGAKTTLTGYKPIVASRMTLRHMPISILSQCLCYSIVRAPLSYRTASAILSHCLRYLIARKRVIRIILFPHFARA